MLRQLSPRIYRLQTVHVFLHRFFLLLVRFDEFELRATAVKVVARTVDAKISIADEIIGQESDADGEGDELAGKGDERFFGWGEKLSSGREVAFCQFFEHRHLHAHFREIALVFERGTGGGADHVAEIVERATGHDGVEIDNTDFPSGFHVEHDVVELRVVMRDAFGNLSPGQSVKQHIDHRLEFPRKINLLFCQMGAVEMIVGHRFLQ